MTTTRWQHCLSFRFKKKSCDRYIVPPSLLQKSVSPVAGSGKPSMQGCVETCGEAGGLLLPDRPQLPLHLTSSFLLLAFLLRHTYKEQSARVIKNTGLLSLNLLVLVNGQLCLFSHNNQMHLLHISVTLCKPFINMAECVPVKIPIS